MDILTKIYWLRVALGGIAGLVSAALPVVAQSVTGNSVLAQMSELNTLLNSITIALLIYLVSFYLLKAKYVAKIEKPSKIMSMGIFIYFFTWLVVMVLTLSVIIGPIPAT
ncbi:MAG: hypothetical protein N3D85_02135 [Candidatus Bathyarchaeota archaeon]|nr:hypothetical protein [Candidatus Bathyarchaeota archaeon]